MNVKYQILNIKYELLIIINFYYNQWLLEGVGSGGQQPPRTSTYYFLDILAGNVQKHIIFLYFLENLFWIYFLENWRVWQHLGLILLLLVKNNYVYTNSGNFCKKNIYTFFLYKSGPNASECFLTCARVCFKCTKKEPPKKHKKHKKQTILCAIMPSILSPYSAQYSAQ